MIRPNPSHVQDRITHNPSHMKDKTSISARLSRNIRRLRGDLSQAAFAKKLGVSEATINRLESESQNTTINTLENICKGLKMDITELLKP